jgi:hypothetical protein
MSDEVDIDWEFSAPHWCDLSQEDTENPDMWFDRQREDYPLIPPENLIPLHKTKIMRSIIPRPRPTRVLVSSFHKLDPLPSAFTTSAIGRPPLGVTSELACSLKNPPINKSNPLKVQTRIPFNERRNVLR